MVTRSVPTRSVVLAVSLAATATLAACGGGPGEITLADPTTTTAPPDDSTTTSSAPAEATSTTTAAIEAAATSTTLADSGVELLEIDPAWVEQPERFRVFGVDADDTLNVRSAPSLDGEILTALPPDATGLVLYDQNENDGTRNWWLVQLVTADGTVGAGWVAQSFTRPVAVSLEQQGTPDTVAAPLALDIVERLTDRDALAARVGEAGLLISPDGFIDLDADVVLTAEEVAGSDEEFLWGYTDGEGAPIESTVTGILESMAASNAVVATEVIGHDTTVGAGNTINNVAEAFPGARLVEFHFSGTEFYGGLDWSSLRVIIDTSGAEPVLLALVADAWTV